MFQLLLKDVDAVVYVDADAVLLSPLDKMWNYFSRFNSTQMLALVAEHEDPKMGWYNKQSKIPYFLPLGLNSGVALMNLTRMRQVNFTKAIINYEHTYGRKLAWFDQDLLNIFCRFSPDRFYQMDCSANYRGDHCAARHVHPNSTCKFADKHGVLVLHGSKRHFYSNPTLKAVYQTFRTHDLKSDQTAGLLNNLTKNLGQAKGKSPCRNVSQIFLKHIQELVFEDDVH
ncbi:glucoside xylosyltransferase 1-like [Littorina saxatilis]|uniref:UDP-D-xylose:beta-D-glucoside alpha-1,3-D-xylosyltransferase n=1 Tax=Littorina saxatilis TaxID=31220 RepID=A0AAN9GDA9_9CAEN